MSDDQAADGTQREPTKSPAFNGAFLGIGFVFLILGITQMSDDDGGGVAFLGVGLTFIALAGASGVASGKRPGPGGPAGPDTSSDGTGTDGPTDRG
ncbi:hypothetical protein [Cellulomonas xiejunii]|uniref:Uncharacterized protein n=1 Tax=Cellulomonas xiejunii TaxID=2968083 RepID=A0ABY5KNN2_9CELL|nr:hypothetical protein [Cellulomonas xiejunii]MCC2321276.1 hypothetical protein [Cellulomonas xiejunii]UUI71864.1 hypothetical protein NP048_19090 [Cellulomonas xiejunii]